MAIIVSDLSGELRKQIFYHFELMYDDRVPVGEPTPEWVIAPRTPTNDALIDADKPYYLHLEDYAKLEEVVEIRDCPANSSHVTLRYYKTLHANLSGGVRIAPFVPTVPRCYCGVSEELFNCTS